MQKEKQLKHLVFDIGQVPSRWIFEYYCDLPERLLGQNLIIKSKLNSKDTRPSMSIFVNRKTGKYRFNDFSTGIKGDGVTLVGILFNISLADAIRKIVDEYNTYLLTHSDYNLDQFKVQTSYSVKNWTLRKWNTLDKDYWQQYKISSANLRQFNIYPLAKYYLEKEIEGIKKNLTIEGHYIYGFFTKDREIYKIYNPRLKENRFVKVRNHIQGVDQLQFIHPTLMITKSLKDIVAMSKFGWETEFVAPDSENVILPQEFIGEMKVKYKNLIVLFDNDDAGYNAAARYKEIYNIDSVVCPLAKDPTDAIRDFGVDKTKESIESLIKQVIK